MTDDTVDLRDPGRVDVVLGALESRRRRLILDYVVLRGETTIGELAEVVAAIEGSVDKSDVTPADRKRVYISLYQTHVPHLADVGLVEADDGAVTGTAESQPISDRLNRFIGDGYTNRIDPHINRLPFD